jgi:hypothetical protein
MTSLGYTTFFEGVLVTSTTTGAGADVIYTVPAKHSAEVTLLNCSNSSSTGNITIEVYHTDDASYHALLSAHSINNGTTFKAIESDRLYLHAGDKVVASVSANDMDVCISGKLVYNPTR